ncbi:MFS transporter [Sanguibacter sp. Leaf3]|uniref:MFS transporter n=1 Tax=Sanguibacter sp. Leaf3 TaxID=1736209 RepID=UPI00138F31EA|nr:MFS transporter [Sanguibacter sp. Leaf3]
MAIVYVPQTIFPEFASDLEISEVAARDAFTASALSYALAFFAFGPLSDVYSARALASSGAVATALAGGLTALTTSFPMFVVAAAATGVCAASVPSAMLALAARAGNGRTGRSFGVILAATVAGITLGRGVGALLAGSVGWRWTYVVLASAILVAGLSSLALPRTTSRSQSVVRAYAAALTMIARPDVLRFLGVGGSLFFGYLGLTTVLTLRLSDPPLSLGPSAIGAINLSGLIALAGAPLAGALVPRLGAKKVSLLGLCLCLAGTVAVRLATDAVGATLGLLILYLGVFAAQPGLMVRLTQLVGVDQKGSASASYFLVCLLAGSFLGWLWQDHGWALVVVASAAAVVLTLVLASTTSDTRALRARGATR